MLYEVGMEFNTWVKDCGSGRATVSLVAIDFMQLRVKMGIILCRRANRKCCVF